MPERIITCCACGWSCIRGRFRFHRYVGSQWLEAYTDQVGKVKTLPRCAILCDPVGDGEYRLILVDLDVKTKGNSIIKVYKGTQLVESIMVKRVPSCIASFYCDDILPRLPVLAVACGSKIYFYKNLKPFHVLQLPDCPLSQQETDAWKKILENSEWSVNELCEELAKAPQELLSMRSKHLLRTPPDRREESFKAYPKTMPRIESEITCMTTLNKSKTDRNAVACLVAATALGNIYVIDPHNFGILHQANADSSIVTPVIIKCIGLYIVDYKIIIATKDSRIFCLKKEWFEGKFLAEVSDDIVDMEIIAGENHIVVAGVDNRLTCFTRKGQKLWSTDTPALITCMCVLRTPSTGMELLAVGLRDATIGFYLGKDLADCTSINEPPSVVLFGQLGQEENVLVTITTGGSINIKILKRNAQFMVRKEDPSENVTVKSLILPKRNKLNTDQSSKNKNNTSEIHQRFQEDLLNLKLTAARTLLDNNLHQTESFSSKELQIFAQILGLGPKFVLLLNLRNISETPSTNLTVHIHVDPLQFLVDNYFTAVPLIPPGLTYKLQVKIKENMLEDHTFLNNQKRMLKIFVVKNRYQNPVIAATIAIPQTEVI